MLQKLQDLSAGKLSLNLASNEATCIEALLI